MIPGKMKRTRNGDTELRQKLIGHIQKADDISHPAGNIESHYAGNGAPSTGPADDLIPLAFEQCGFCFCRLTIAISIHKAPHHGRDLEAEGTLLPARAALSAVEAS
jgi:hypothetical protein